MSGFVRVSRSEAKALMARDDRTAALDAAVVVLEDREQYVAEIGRLWKRAQETFLTIGRYLVQAAERLEHGEYQVMVETELPFGYDVSYKLRRVAEAIDGRRLLLEEVPPNYTTIFQLASLSDEQLAAARATQPPVIRPDVRREEIVEFKRRLAREEAASSPPVDSMKRRKQLMRRLRSLEEKRRLLDQEIAQIERELEP